MKKHLPSKLTTLILVLAIMLSAVLISAIPVSAESSEEEFSVMKGDVNGDGSIDILDLLTLKQHINSDDSLDDWYAQEWNADVNGDNAVDDDDLEEIAEYLLKKRNSFSSYFIYEDFESYNTAAEMKAVWSATGNPNYDLTTTNGYGGGKAMVLHMPSTWGANQYTITRTFSEPVVLSGEQNLFVWIRHYSTYGGGTHPIAFTLTVHTASGNISYKGSGWKFLLAGEDWNRYDIGIAEDTTVTGVTMAFSSNGEDHIIFDDFGFEPVQPTPPYVMPDNVIENFESDGYNTYNKVIAEGYTTAHSIAQSEISPRSGSYCGQYSVPTDGGGYSFSAFDVTLPKNVTFTKNDQISIWLKGDTEYAAQQYSVNIYTTGGTVSSGLKTFVSDGTWKNIIIPYGSLAAESVEITGFRIMCSLYPQARTVYIDDFEVQPKPTYVCPEGCIDCFETYESSAELTTYSWLTSATGEGWYPGTTALSTASPKTGNQCMQVNLPAGGTGMWYSRFFIGINKTLQPGESISMWLRSTQNVGFKFADVPPLLTIDYSNFGSKTLGDLGAGYAMNTNGQWTELIITNTSASAVPVGNLTMNMLISALPAQTFWIDDIAIK